MRSNTINIQDICKSLRPILGTKIDKIFLEYSLAESQERKHEIFQIVLALYSRYVDDNILDNNIFLETPKVGKVNAEYEIGKIQYPNKKIESFGLRERDWVRHVCISGMSGSGKTTLAIRILYNFIAKKKPFIVFDWKKSFRQMMEFSDDLVYFTVGRPRVTNFFRMNINMAPKGISPDEWITAICDLLCEVYGASFGVHKLLSEVMQKTFRDFGVYSGSENYPTWYQIKDRLENMEEKSSRHSRQSEWLTSALRIAHSLTFGEFGQTINDKNRHNLKIEDLLDNQVVFELDGLGVMEKKFFCSYILLYIYKFKKSMSTGEQKGFTSAILVDEAHNIFLKEKTSFVQESVTDQIYREIREYGIGLICLDQHVSRISETVLGNSSTNIAFQQVLPQDVDTISRIMFLFENKQIFTKLDIGKAIVKLTERHHDPFLINVEMVKSKKKPLNDEDLRKRIKQHCLYKKRMKLAEEMMKNESLANEIKRVSDIMKQSGAKPKEEDIRKMIEKDMNNALSKNSTKKSFLKNHLQEEILDKIQDKAEIGKTINDIKKEFINEGSKQTDVNNTIRYFKDTKEGSTITRFLQLTKSHSKTKLKPKDIIKFLQKLQDVDGNLTITQLYDELDLSVRKCNAIKNWIAEIGYVEIREQKDAKGAKKKIQFSTKGIKFMKELDA